jgi:hypothetical protein
MQGFGRQVHNFLNFATVIPANEVFHVSNYVLEAQALRRPPLVIDLTTWHILVSGICGNRQRCQIWTLLSFVYKMKVLRTVNP